MNDVVNVEAALAVLKGAPTLGDIFQLQKMLEASATHDFSGGLKHTFSEGAVARELLLPAGSLVVGKVHRFGHLNIVSRGRVTVWTTDGRHDIDATQHPVTFVSTPGTKRVVYTHETAVWTVIHLTSETDIARLEAEEIVPEAEFKSLIDSIPKEILGQINIQALTGE